uniref:Fork-head domain-containing protein n=1 Tax=Parastrongyloides trichosuri TaxID=131310 RepID=A0A0N4ZP45_PARTI
MNQYYNTPNVNPLASLERLTSSVVSKEDNFKRTKVQKREKKEKHPKTALSFPQLAGLILINSTTKCLPVNEIYDIVQDLFLCYNDSLPTWKNSIRHNLSTNAWFYKVRDQSTEDGLRQSCIWGLSKLSNIRDIIAKCHISAKKDKASIINNMKNPNLYEAFINGTLMIVPKYCGTYRKNPSIPVFLHYQEFYNEKLELINGKYHIEENISSKISVPGTISPKNTQSNIVTPRRMISNAISNNRKRKNDDTYNLYNPYSYEPEMKRAHINNYQNNYSQEYYQSGNYSQYYNDQYDEYYQQNLISYREEEKLNYSDDSGVSSYYSQSPVANTIYNNGSYDSNTYENTVYESTNQDYYPEILNEFFVPKENL